MEESDEDVTDDSASANDEILNTPTTTRPEIAFFVCFIEEKWRNYLESISYTGWKSKFQNLLLTYWSLFWKAK